MYTHTYTHICKYVYVLPSRCRAPAAVITTVHYLWDNLSVQAKCTRIHAHTRTNANTACPTIKMPCTSGRTHNRALTLITLLSLTRITLCLCKLRVKDGMMFSRIHDNVAIPYMRYMFLQDPDLCMFHMAEYSWVSLRIRPHPSLLAFTAFFSCSIVKLDCLSRGLLCGTSGIRLYIQTARTQLRNLLP